MTSRVEVRRIRLHEWADVRDIRLRAVSDPDAAIAFLSTIEQERAREDDFWRRRTIEASMGENSAQFAGVAPEGWVATASVLLREPGATDHLGTEVTEIRADVVGVYVAPSHRGSGLLARLFAAAEEWARAAGVDALTLDVHRDNVRARSAYERLGFIPTGEVFTSTIGPELQMRRAIVPPGTSSGDPETETETATRRDPRR